MNSQEYLERLGAALSQTVPARERMEILRYYKEYFEEAGPEGEADVIRELGDPEELAWTIAKEGGFSGNLDYEKTDGHKKGRRLWIIAASVGIVLVIAAIVLAWVIGGYYSYSNGRTDRVENGVIEPSEQQTPGQGQEKVFDQTGEFTKIVVEIGVGDVVVQVGEEGNVTLSSSGTDRSGQEYRVEYSLENEVLKIWSTPRNVSTNGDEEVNALVVITVPGNTELVKADISTGLGNVDLSGLSGREIDVKTGLGDLSAKGMGEVQELSMESGLGDISLESVPAHETDLKTGMGTVYISAGCAAEECGYEFESGMGTIEIEGKQYNGKVELDRNGQYKLEANTGMGDIKVTFLP